MDAFKPRSVKIADAPLSVTDLYTIGIGPSSSHTVGPMKAAAMFARELVARRSNASARVLVELFGSLALTGKGHRTDIAVILGLMGWMPETVDPGSADALVGGIRETKVLPLGGGVSIDFNEARDLIFRKGDFHPGHPNAISFTAFTGEATVSRTFFSVGGGAIVEEGEGRPSNAAGTEPYPFSSAADLLSIGRNERITFAQLVLNNERTLRTARHFQCRQESAAPCPLNLEAQPRAADEERKSGLSRSLGTRRSGHGRRRIAGAVNVVAR